MVEEQKDNGRDHSTGAAANLHNRVDHLRDLLPKVQVIIDLDEYRVLLSALKYQMSPLSPLLTNFHINVQ